jgi:two-component system NtrC family sensor kinase
LALASALIFPPEGQDVQAQLLQGICNLLNAETGAWVLIEDSTAALLTKKTLRADSTWLYQVDHLHGQGLLRTCLRSGQAVLANHLEADPLFDPGFDGVAQMEVRSILCAPLIASGQTLGVLEIINRRDAGFAFPDLQLLLMIAAVVAHVMVGNRVIQQLKVTNADLEASRWELLRSRNTLRALVDSMPAGLYIVDQKYKLIAINMFRSNITGQPPRALVGRQCYEALFNRLEACPDCRVKETLTGGSSTSRFERRMIQPADLAEWEISTYPIVDEEEQVIQAILLEQDVTDKRRLESILIQSEKLAAVGQLAAGVAHEINNPLTAIIANAQLLQRSLPPDDEMQESVDLIIHAGARATQVVRSLLDFARKEP